MAAEYSTIVTEPINDILDGILNGHIASLTKDVYSRDESAIAIVVDYFGGKPITSLHDIDKVDGWTVSEEGGKTTFRLLVSAS